MNGKAVLTAVVAHGAGSSADFVRRAFAAPLAEVGYDVVSWDRRTPVESAAGEFADLVARSSATLVGGVSVGAILAIGYAIAHPQLDGMLVALPPPPPSTSETDADSPGDLAEFIGRATRDAVPWVADEIRAAWPAYGLDGLLRELRSAAVANPPAAEELAACQPPVGVVALADDPVHPAAVAEAWRQAMPHAALETVQLHEPAAGVSVIGAAAVRAWQRARRSTCQNHTLP